MTTSYAQQAADLRRQLEAVVTDQVRPVAAQGYAQLLDYAQLVMEYQAPLLALATRLRPSLTPARARRLAFTALSAAVVGTIIYIARRPRRRPGRRLPRNG